MIAKCNRDMKLWFSNEQKAKLSSILDAYSAQSKKYRIILLVSTYGIDIGLC